MNHSFAYETGRTAGHNPGSGKTWATFVSSGDVAPPKGISLGRKAGPIAPAAKGGNPLGYR
jgi:hypothetical protein